MNPEDDEYPIKLNISNIAWDFSYDTLTPMTWSGSTDAAIDTVDTGIVMADGHSWRIVADDCQYPQYSQVIQGDDPETCLSDVQQSMHGKFPSLEEAWKNYQLIYQLVKGKEPGDEIL